MRLHFLTAFLATVLIGLVTGQFPFRNGFQPYGFASSNGGVQASAGVNSFQSYNQAPPSNFNPNGRSGFTGTQTQEDFGGGMEIKPVNPSSSFQQFPSSNVPVNPFRALPVNSEAFSSTFQQFPSVNVPVNPLRVPPVNDEAFSNSFQQFPSVNVPVNPLRVPPVNAAAASNTFQQVRSINYPGQSLRPPDINSAASNSFQQFSGAHVPVNPFGVPPINEAAASDSFQQFQEVNFQGNPLRLSPINAAVSSNSFQQFSNGNIPTGEVPLVNTAIHSNGFHQYPSNAAPIGNAAPNLPVIKPPIQPYPMVPLNTDQIRTGENKLLSYNGNPSNTFRPVHAPASFSSGIPNDYPKFPFPRGFLDELKASLGAGAKSKSTLEDNSGAFASPPSGLNKETNKEMANSRKNNRNKSRNGRKSKSRSKTGEKGKVNANSQAMKMQPATSKHDNTLNARAGEILSNMAVSDIEDTSPAALLSSSITSSSFKTSITDSESEMSISNVEAVNSQGEETKSMVTATIPTTQSGVTNSKISKMNSEQINDFSVTKSPDDGKGSMTVPSTGVTESSEKTKNSKNKRKSKKKNKKNVKSNLNASKYETTQTSNIEGSISDSSSIKDAKVEEEMVNALDTTTEVRDETSTAASTKAGKMDSTVMGYSDLENSSMTMKSKNKSKKKNKNRKKNKSKLSSAKYETAQESDTKGSSTSDSSSIQITKVEEETTNAPDITTETKYETSDNANAKSNKMDSLVTGDSALENSSMDSNYEEITTVTQSSSLKSDVQASKSEEMQKEPLATQTDLSSSKTGRSHKKKKSNNTGKRNNKNNISSSKRKTVLKTLPSQNDTSSINLAKSNNYDLTNSEGPFTTASYIVEETMTTDEALDQSHITSKDKYISSNSVSDYVTDQTTKALSTDLNNNSKNDPNSKVISNNAMSTLEADNDSQESKVNENYDTSKNISNSSTSDKTAIGSENQGIPNDYPKFPFPKGFLDELMESLEAGAKSKSTGEAASETTTSIPESVNKKNKKEKFKHRKKQHNKNKNSNRKSKGGRKDTGKAEDNVDSQSTEKSIAISTTSTVYKLANTANTAIVADEMNKSIDITSPTTQILVTKLEPGNIDSETISSIGTKNTATSTGVSTSPTEPPEKQNLKARKSKSKSKSKNKNKKNMKNKISTSNYESTQKSTTKDSTSYSSSIQTSKSQSEPSNSLDDETEENYQTATTESLTTNRVESVPPSDGNSAVPTKYETEKRVTDSSYDKSDLLTQDLGEKQMESGVNEAGKLRSPKNKKRNRANRRKNNKKMSSTATSESTTPVQVQDNPSNDAKLNKNTGEASEFIDTTLATTSYEFIDNTAEKENTPKSEVTSNTEAISSQNTGTATLKSEIGESSDESKSVTNSAIPSKTSTGLQKEDSDRINDSILNTSSTLAEMEISTTSEIGSNNKGASSKISRKEPAGKGRTSNRKSIGKRKKKKRTELNSKTNKYEITETVPTDTKSSDIDMPTTKAPTFTKNSGHATFSTDQSFPSKYSGESTFPGDPYLANFEKTSKLGEATATNIAFTDLDTFSTDASIKATDRALNPRKKSKHKKGKLKRKSKNKSQQTEPMSSDLSKYSPSTSDSQLENVLSQTTLLMDNTKTTVGEIILSANSKTYDSDSDITGDFDTTTETVEVSTLSATKAVSDNLNIAPKESSKNTVGKSSKGAKKSQSKKGRKLANRKSANKKSVEGLKEVTVADTSSKYSASDADKQPVHSEGIVTDSTKVNTKSIYTTPMNNVNSEFSIDPDLTNSPNAFEDGVRTTRSPDISSTGFMKTSSGKVRKRKNKLKQKKENSALLKKKSVKPNELLQFTSSDDEATEQTEPITTELPAFSTTEKNAKSIRSSTTANAYPGRNKSQGKKKMKKRKQKRKNSDLIANSEFLRTYSSPFTSSGNIRDPDRMISSTDSLESTPDSAQEASSTQYLPETSTTGEEVGTTTQIPIQENVKTGNFGSEAVNKKKHGRRGNNAHKKSRGKHKGRKMKKKLKDNHADVIQPASDISSEVLDVTPTTQGFTSETETFTPTSTTFTEVDEGTSDISGEIRNASQETALSGPIISTDVNNIYNLEDKLSATVTEVTLDKNKSAKGNTGVTQRESTNENEETSTDKIVTLLRSTMTPMKIEITETETSISTPKGEDTTNEKEISSDLEATTNEIETSITTNGFAVPGEKTTNVKITEKEIPTTMKEITTSMKEITTISTEIPVTTAELSETEKITTKTEEETTEEQITVVKKKMTTNKNIVTTSVYETLMPEMVTSDIGKEITKTDEKTSEEQITVTKKEVITNENTVTTSDYETLITETVTSNTEKKTTKADEKTTGSEAIVSNKESTSSQSEETTDEDKTSITTIEQIKAGKKTIKSEDTSVEETSTTKNEFTTSGNKVTTTKNEASITTNESIKSEETSTKTEETVTEELITTKKGNSRLQKEHNVESETPKATKESSSVVKKTTEVVDGVDTTEYKGTEKSTHRTTAVTHIKSTKTKGEVTKPLNTDTATESIYVKAPNSTAKKVKTTFEGATSTTIMEADVIDEESTETPETESTLHTTYSYPFDFATETPPPGVECRKSERYYKCVPHCRHTCFNYDNYVVPCPTFCMPGCFCDPGLVVDENGDCVDISQCKNYTCGEDEEWWDCKPTYHNTCANFARAEARLDFDCESGCFCKDGLIQDSDGSCVEIWDCSDPICEETEEATDCLNSCNTCEADCHACSITMCIPGCDCLDGYKRDVNGTCIHASKCPVCTSPSPVLNSTED